MESDEITEVICDVYAHFEPVSQRGSKLYARWRLALPALERSKKTLRDFDVFCRTDIEPMSGVDIQALRKKEGVSQAVLAHHLNVSTTLVSDWERDVKRRSGPSLKLLPLIRSKGRETIV